MVGTTRQAGRLLEYLLAVVGPIEMGFRIQGLAAHILLALGHRIIEVKNCGHPDLIAQRECGIVRVEVEADTRGMGVHLPEPGDLAALCPRMPGDHGYFAVAICGPLPRWILVDSCRLAGRKTKLHLPLLDALSDCEQSEAWSRLFERMIVEHQNRLSDFSYQWLAGQALEQRCLIHGT